MKSRLFFITYVTANLGLVAYGLIALVQPSILLDPFSKHVYQFPAGASPAETYLAALFRLLGFFNLIPGALGLILLQHFRNDPQAWIGRTVIAISLLSYLGPVVFDNTVGSIGFFEVIEHILFVAIIISGVIMLIGGEISNRAAAQREVWQPWTVGEVSDDNYGSLMRLPGYHRDLDVVAVVGGSLAHLHNYPLAPPTSAPDGVIAAYVNGWIDPVNRIGDFGPVGARPAYRRQGLTRAALLEGLRRMQARGMDRVCVSTGVSNTPALRLYESIGFQRIPLALLYRSNNTY